MDSSIKKKIPLTLRLFLDKVYNDYGDILSIDYRNSTESAYSITFTEKEKSDFYFKFSNRSNNAGYKYSAVVLPMNAETLSNQALAFRDIKQLEGALSNWIQLLRQFNEYSPFFDRPLDSFSKIDFEEYGEFKPDEKEYIKQALNELKKTSKIQLQLNESQFNALSEKIDYLSESVERLNKTDWKNIVIGSLMSTLFALAITTENMKFIWDTLTNYLRNIPNLIIN